MFGRNVDAGGAGVVGVPGVTLVGQAIPNTDPTLEQTDYDIFDGKVYLACRDPEPGTANPNSTEAQNPHYYDANLTEGSGKGYYVRTYQTKMYAVQRPGTVASRRSTTRWCGTTRPISTAVVVTKLDKTNPVRLHRLRRRDRPVRQRQGGLHPGRHGRRA